MDSYGKKKGSKLTRDSLVPSPRDAHCLSGLCTLTTLLLHKRIQVRLEVILRNNRILKAMYDFLTSQNQLYSKGIVMIDELAEHGKARR